MKITTKSDYAMIMMVELTKQKKDQVLPLSAIADKYRLSLSYLEQLAARLKKNKLVTSRQGVLGGYLLAVDPTKITARQIIEAVGDEIYPVECTCPHTKTTKKCQISDVCNAKKSWSVLGKMLYKSMESITLKYLVK